MENNKLTILLSEYQEMRREILERVKILVWLINWGTIGLFLSLIAGIFIYQAYPFEIFEAFLLFLPVVYAGLLFNYQANQATLEKVAKYINLKLKPKIQELSTDNVVLDWESFFGEEKKSMHLTSFLKVVPMLLPLTLPIVLIIANGGLSSGSNAILQIFDLILIFIASYNFRYKLNRWY